MAIAPELYARQGAVSKLTDFAEIIKIVERVSDAQVMADLDATLAFAKSTGKVDGARVAITGFCWGGRIVWLYAARGGVKTGAAWYGRISHAVNANTTKTPLDLASKLKVPVIGLYAGKDSGIPVTHVALMKRELAAGSSGSDIIVYPDAQHGFHADYRPSYSKAAAEDAWSKTLAWFKKNGV
jgi:carboxymethylenebutenolidase